MPRMELDEVMISMVITCEVVMMVLQGAFHDLTLLDDRDLVMNDDEVY
jgi:hypothetical protein